MKSEWFGYKILNHVLFTYVKLLLIPTKLSRYDVH